MWELSRQNRTYSVGHVGKVHTVGDEHAVDTVHILEVNYHGEL